MPGSSKWSFRSGLQNKSCAYFISPCMLHTLHSSSFDSSNIILWRLEIMNLLMVVFFIPLLPFPFRPRYHSQHPNLKYPQPMFLPPCETRFHTHIKQHARLYLCVFWSLYFWVANCLADGSGPNGRGHHPSSFCSCWFLSERNFDMLGLFTNIWTLPHFQMIYYICLCIVILCCMLFMEQKYIFSFLNIYF